MLHTFLFLPRTPPGISRGLAKPIPKGMERRYYTSKENPPSRGYARRANTPSHEQPIGSTADYIPASISAVAFEQVIGCEVHSALTGCHV